MKPKISNDLLKPCPFCGGEARLLHLDYDGNRVWGVFCGNDTDDEYSHGHYIDNYASETEAVNAWNTRAGQTLNEDEHGFVRCMDCKHMHTVRHWLGMDVYECWLHADPESGALGKEPTEPDGFCAWGEKELS